MRRALVCAPLPPEFDRESGSRRTFDLIMLLREAGWAVSFFCQGGSPDQARYLDALRQRGIPVYAGTFANELGDEFTFDLGRLVARGQFDLVLIAFWHLAARHLPTIRYFAPGARVVIDTIDLHFLRATRKLLTDERGHFHRLDSAFGREMASELRAYAAVDGLLTVSPTEAAMLDTLLTGTPPVFTVPDLEDLPVSPLPATERHGILLLGSYRHPPNREAVELLCRDILPRVDPTLLAQHPVSIVGTGLTPALQALAAGLTNVNMVGWVPSLDPYLHRSRLTVLPLRHGAGTKRKLIQALMAGTPSVSTTIGAEGLGLTDGEQVLIADDPSRFAAAMERLMTDDSLWRRLAEAGRAHIAATHSREAVRRALFAMIDRILGLAPVAPAVAPPPTPVLAPTNTSSSGVNQPPFPDGHFYSPTIDIAEVTAAADRIWPSPSPRRLPALDFNDDGQRAFLAQEFSTFIGDYDYSQSEHDAGSPFAFFDGNGQYTGLDARALFVMLRSLRPRRMIEVGSGFSSLLTADVNRRFLQSALDFTCIEPYPRPFLVAGVPGISRLVQQKVQETPLDLYDTLENGDILFIDSSHVAKTGSDVNFLVFEVLPRLKRGVVIHFHDIFLPEDYPKSWVIGEQRSWSEAYLVRALLMGSRDYQVLLGCHYASRFLPELVREVLGGVLLGGGSLWLRKQADGAN